MGIVSGGGYYTLDVIPRFGGVHFYIFEKQGANKILVNELYGHSNQIHLRAGVFYVFLFSHTSDVFMLNFS